MNKDNPFYSNHIFSKDDLDRAIINKWQDPLLWLLPTYVQFAEGKAIFYKQWNGRYYLMRIEDL
jgi:hypothetical protein